MTEPVFMKLGMYIMAPEPIFKNPSRQYVYPLSLLGNGSVKTLPRQRIHETIELLCRFLRGPCRFKG
jgi:hypothetical protein